MQPRDVCFDHQNLIVLYLEVGLGQQGTKSSLGNSHSSCSAQPRADFAIQEGTCKASVKGVALQHISILTQFCQWPNASKIKLRVRQPAQTATTPVTCFSVPWVCSACLWWGPGCQGGCTLPGQGLIRFSSLMVQQPVLQGPGPAWGSPQLQRVVYCQFKEKKTKQTFENNNNMHLIFILVLKTTLCSLQKNWFFKWMKQPGVLLSVWNCWCSDSCSASRGLWLLCFI